MQPYLFPYLGYYQLMNSVDEFVILDDVNFINKGWINRNRILLNGKDHLFTMPLREASQNKLIRDIELLADKTWNEKFLKTVHGSYRKAPHFAEVYALLEKVFRKEAVRLTEILAYSIHLVNEYLKIKTKIVESSADFKVSHLKGEDRILAICQLAGATHYHNLIGGVELYSKEKFSQQHIELHFIKSALVPYPQFQHEFVPWLSMIDVMMFNHPDQISQMLNQIERV